MLATVLRVLMAGGGMETVTRGAGLIARHRQMTPGLRGAVARRHLRGVEGDLPPAAASPLVNVVDVVTTSRWQLQHVFFYRCAIDRGSFVLVHLRLHAIFSTRTIMLSA